MQQAVEGEAVGVVDLPRPQRGAGHDQLVTAGEDGDPQATVDAQLGAAHGGGEPQMLGLEPGTGGDDQGAGGDVLAGTADVGAGLAVRGYPHPIAVGGAGFLDDHRIGARGYRGAGEDARCRAGRQR